MHACIFACMLYSPGDRRDVKWRVNEQCMLASLHASSTVWGTLENQKHGEPWWWVLGPTWEVGGASVEPWWNTLPASWWDVGEILVVEWWVLGQTFLEP